MNNIPKLIHYCWFGNSSPNSLIKSCMKSWDLLSDYEFIKWNEENCDLKINKFVVEAIKRGKWAFVSDFFRLNALYNYGGIYLDTDVVVFKKFDDLLNQKLFLGFIYDSLVGTAVIGANKKNTIIGHLLDIYDRLIWSEDAEGFVVENDSKYNCVFKNNNDLFTFYLLKEFNKFSLSGRTQFLDDFTIFAKEEFEVGKIFGKSHCIHKCDASWTSYKNSLRTRMNKTIKFYASKLPFMNFESLIRHITYKYRNTNSPFYIEYLNEKRNSR